MFAYPNLFSKRKSWLYFCCFTRFFVTLEEISAFLCIKAVWGIEEKQGYDLETVLNSTFCNKLLSMNT